MVRLRISSAILGTFSLFSATLFCSPALAGTATTPISVTATVIGDCTITSPVALAFGSYDPVVTNATTALTASPNALSVSCTKGDAALISLDLGLNATGATRRMKDASTDYLTYEIYTTAARSTVWNAVNTVAYTSTTKAATLIPVYGTVAAGQDVPVGSYSDTITATITF